MIIGQTIVAVASASGSGDTVVYTPWVASFGDKAIMAYEVIDADNNGDALSLTVEAATKNSEDVDPGTALTPTSTVTAVGTHSFTVSGIKELVRLKFTLTLTGAETVTSTGYMHLRPLNPSWQTN